MSHRVLQTGNAVTDWETWTPTGSWSTNTTYTGMKRRVGDTLECIVKVALGGAPDAVALTVNLPSGLTVDTAKMQTGITSIGFCHVLDSGTADYSCDVTWNSSASTVISVRLLNSSGTYLDATNGAGHNAPITTLATGDYFILTFRLPITGWSSNIQVADRAVEEYASNSNATSTAADTTSFAYGPAGSSIPALALGTQGIRRVQFASNILPTDTLILEAQAANGGWIPFGDVYGALVVQGTSVYGAGIATSSSGANYISVVFYPQGISPSGATYGANGGAWSGLTGKWRVRKVSSGAVIGFPVSTANVLGRTDGSTPGTGYIGETLRQYGNNVMTITTDVEATVYTQTLSAGVWSITAHATGGCNGNNSLTYTEIKLKIDGTVVDSSSQAEAGNTMTNPRQAPATLHYAGSFATGQVVTLTVKVSSPGACYVDRLLSCTRIA